MQFRQALGYVLREKRLSQGKTMRDVAGSAMIALGYLSEVERGDKEASSQVVQSLCDSLETPLWALLRETADLLEYQHILNTTPAEDYTSRASVLR